MAVRANKRGTTGRYQAQVASTYHPSPQKRATGLGTPGKGTLPTPRDAAEAYIKRYDGCTGPVGTWEDVRCQ